MDQLWYYAHDGQSLGPVPFDELTKFAADGKLSPSDSVCPVGSQQWQSAATVSGLFAVPPPPPLPADALPVLPLDEPKALPSDDARPRVRDRDRDDYRPRQPGPADEIIQVVTRAFASELHALKQTESEQRDLKRAKIASPVLRNYAVWRRSVLAIVILPGFLAGLFNLISSFSTEGLSPFGILLAFVNAVAQFALPVTAIVAVVNYTRLRMSSRVLLLGALIAYAAPLGSAVFPAAWLVDDKASGSFKGALALVLKNTIAMSFAVLAVLSGLTRSGVRIKGLFPTTIIPGWMAILGAPLLVLAGMAAFGALTLQYGNLLLVLGIVGWIGAPTIYLWKPRLLIRPLTRNKEIAALARTRLYVLISSLSGALLIVLFLLVEKFDGSSVIVGFSKSNSLIRAWDPALHAFWLDYLARSLFLSVLFADLLLMMNLSIRKEQKDFAPTQDSADLDKDLDELDTLLAKPPARHRDYDDGAYDRKRDDDRRRDRDDGKRD